jgi:heme exporter protein D
MSLQEFLYMGGYGLYVWSAYGLCAIVLIFNVFQSLSRQRKILREPGNRLRRQESKK